MDFRDRLLATLRAIAPLLEVEGVLVIGSEVPNLLEPDAASTLVVSQDVDIGVPVAQHDQVRQRLGLIEGLQPSSEEPSVWVPLAEGLIEVKFIGIDAALEDASQSYVKEDSTLPLMVFGDLALLRPSHRVLVDGLSIPVPRIAGLTLEKLLTDRTSEKGERDRLVALGLLICASPEDIEELTHEYRRMTEERRHTVRSSLAILSLMQSMPSMPDPTPHRTTIADLLQQLEQLEVSAP